MTEAKLKFDLADQEDRIRFEQVVKALDAFIVLAQVDQELRNSVKWGTFAGKKLTPEQVDLLDSFRTWFNSELVERDISGLALR